MRNTNRFLPLLICLIWTVSILACYSIAFAAEPDPVSPGIEGSEAGEEGDEPVSTGMSDVAETIGKTFMDGIWSIFAIPVPGFNFTFGQMWLGVLLASVSILVIRIIFGFGASGSGGISSRTSSTSNPKISKERQSDEF